MSCAPGDPEDGDLIGEDGKIAVPDHVAQAIRTLIAWAGDDPTREGLIDTPKRVALFAHYGAGLAILSSIMDIPYNVFCPRFNFALTGVTEINFHHHGDGMVVPQITCHSGTAHLYREGLE